MVPSAVFIGSLHMLEVLEAEESLSAVKRISVGTATSDVGHRRAQVTIWQRAAGLLAEPVMVRQVTDQQLQRLAATGMGLRKVTARAR